MGTRSVEAQELRTDGLHQDMRQWLEELESALQVDEDGRPLRGEPGLPVFGQGEHRPFALLNAATIAAAVVDAQGRLVAATPAFTAKGADALLNAELVLQVVRVRTVRLELAAAGSENGETVELTAYAPAELTPHWRVPSRIRDAARRTPGSVVVLSTMLGERLRPLRAACEVYGLTGLQTRVAVETIHRGGIKAAATALGISYQTAREALSEAMKRVGVERLPGLAGRLTSLAFGVLPGQPASAALLTDAWGLSQRQIAVAGLLADGLSRAEIAQSLRLGEAVVRKELETVFAMLHVSSGAALARKIVEARALSWLTGARDGFGYVEEGAEPLRIMRRPDGTQIAWSDYGPASGKPVLVVHSSMTTRVVSRPLLRALHASGYRPISIDRPGFGMSGLPRGLTPGRYDPWPTAAQDVLLVLDRLKLSRVDLVARGGAQFVAALHAAAGERLGRVVLVNPGPPYRYSGRGKGPIGAMKEAFMREPHIVEVFAPYLAGLLTYPRLVRIIEHWTRGSPPDHGVAHEPETINDFYRAMRMFAVGRFEGFVAEQRAIATDSASQPLAGVADWRVLLGSHDVLYDPEAVVAYWRERLPGAELRIVPDGGRFLAMTHADLVVESLQPTSG